MTEYTELYQRLSNSELLTIIGGSKKYNPIAVETAKTEIEKRQLSEEEIKQAKSKIIQKKTAKKREIEKQKEHVEKLRKNASTIFDTLNPIQNGIQTPEKIIKLIILIFGGLAIYRLYKQYGMFRFMFTDSGADWDISMVEYFFPIILLPVAVILFWNRLKLGWILLTIFLTYSAFNAIVLFVMNLGRQPAGIDAFEEIFPTVSPVVYFMTLLFFGGFLYLICKQGVRNIFKIPKHTMLITISLTIIANSIFFTQFLNNEFDYEHF